jgi:DNA-binding transcriptional ArsR family regulator
VGTSPVQDVNKEPQVDRSTEIFKALSNPVRYRIVQILCGTEQNVKRISEELSMKQCIVSQQLGILRMSGLVDVTKDKGHAFYRISEKRLCQMVRVLASPD